MNAETLDPIEQVTQRIVPAAGAERPAMGPASVFALGTAAAAEPADVPAPAADPRPHERVRATLEACGRLDLQQLVDATGLTLNQVRYTVGTLKQKGVIRELPSEGKRRTYGLAAAGSAASSSFKGWPQPHGHFSTEAAPKPASKRRGRLPATLPPPKAAAPAKPPRKVRAAPAPAPRALAPISTQPTTHDVVPTARPVDDLALGFFSSGEIAIEMDGQVLRLNPARSRKLIDWALRIDTLMDAGGI